MSICSETKWLARRVAFVAGIHLADCLLVMVGVGAALMEPLIMKWLIDIALPRRSFKLLLLGTATFCVSYLVLAVCHKFAAVLGDLASRRIAIKLRVGLFEHLSRLCGKVQGRLSPGDLQQRLEEDAHSVAEFCGSGLTTGYYVVFGVCFTLGAIFLLDWHLGLVVVPFVSLFVWVRRRVQSRLRESSDLIQDMSGARNAFLEEFLAALTQVQLLGREMFVARKFVRLVSKAARQEGRRSLLEFATGLATWFILILAIGATIGYGGYRVIFGGLSIGGLVAFYGYSMSIFDPVEQATTMHAKLIRASASVRRLIEIENLVPSVIDPPEGAVLSKHTPLGLQFDNVCFTYQIGKPVLNAINIRFGCGERAVLSGPTGIGKSTLSKLAVRLYDVSSGSILIDGIDVRKIALRSLREVISLVPQEAVIFNDSIRENVLYGNPKATEAEIEEVASVVQLDRVLLRLPKGWNETLGPRGVTLSGGERQLISLARVLLRRSAILILDEATSALDISCERDVLQRLGDFMKGRIVVVITHRPSVTTWADRVLVFGRDCIVEQAADKTLILAYEENRVAVRGGI